MTPANKMVVLKSVCAAVALLAIGIAGATKLLPAEEARDYFTKTFWVLLATFGLTAAGHAMSGTPAPTSVTEADPPPTVPEVVEEKLVEEKT